MGRVIGSIIGSLLCAGLGVFAVVAIVMACVKRTTGWIVAGVVFLLLGIAGAGVIGVAGFKAFTDARKAQTTRKSVTSSDGWVRLQIPGSWSELPELGADASLKVGNKFAEQYLMIFTDPKSDFRGSLDSFSQLTTKRMLSKLADSSASGPTPLTINGFPAVRVRLEGTANSVRVVYLHTSVETPDGFHQILQWTLPSREKIAFPIFEEVASTFNLARPASVEPSSQPAVAPAIKGKRETF